MHYQLPSSVRVASREHLHPSFVAAHTITQACYWQRSKENSFPPTRFRMLVVGLGFTSLDCQKRQVGGLLVNTFT